MIRYHLPALWRFISRAPVGETFLLIVIFFACGLGGVSFLSLTLRHLFLLFAVPIVLFPLSWGFMVFLFT